MSNQSLCSTDYSINLNYRRYNKYRFWSACSFHSGTGLGQFNSSSKQDCGNWGRLKPCLFAK